MDTQDHRQRSQSHTGCSGGQRHATLCHREDTPGHPYLPCRRGASRPYGYRGDSVPDRTWHGGDMVTRDHAANGRYYRQRSAFSRRPHQLRTRAGPSPGTALVASRGDAGRGPLPEWRNGSSSCLGAWWRRLSTPPLNHCHAKALYRLWSQRGRSKRGPQHRGAKRTETGVPAPVQTRA